MTPTLPNRETRYASEPIELRAEDGKESRKVRGYASVFNRSSENLGSDSRQFFEVIEPGAFDDVLSNNVVALFNHDRNLVLARSDNGTGTLKIGTDERGLWYEFDAPNTTTGNDLLESIKRGDIRSSSFSFSVSRDGQSWEESQVGEGPNIMKRTIKKVSRLYDVSPVTEPAYPDATVALRSLEEFRAETAPPPPAENHSISHWQRRIATY